MAEFFPGLGGLAQGLRLAGGILSPNVFKTVADEDQRRELQENRIRELQVQQTIRGIESGAIEPEAGRAALKQMGFNVPVGPGQDAVAKTEAAKQRAAMAAAIAKLPQDATQAQRLAAIAPFMTPDQQIKLYETTINKRDQLENQLDRIRQDFELRKRALDRKEDKDLLDARFKTVELGIKQQIADLKSIGGGTKAPSGYRYTEGGDLEAIPGGPADLKQQGVFNADTASLTNTVSDLDRLAATANELKNHPGLRGITGVRGAIPNVPGTAAANAEAQLNALKSQVAFSVLQTMRNNSKTGGALGSVSDAEGKRLEANLAALDKAQSFEEMRKSLDKIIAYTNTAKDNMRSAYNVKHQSRGASPAAPAVGPKPGDVEGGYRFKGGDPGKRESWEKI